MNLNEKPRETSNSFLEEVTKASNVAIQACYQCQKCSAGCPVVAAMDIMPNQVVRQIQYGRREKVLSSKTIWICASCHTCSVRCPNDIDIAKVMDTLRHLSRKSGLKAGEAEIPIFHSVFLDTIKATGRIHELSLILRFKLKTRDFLKDAALGWEMFRRGKIKILPQSFGGTPFLKGVPRREIKDIFNSYEKGEGR
jgi:heterodisulfide reductase subunit C